jgi:hypothetical protein
MHKIAELLEAAAIRLGSADNADLGRALGARGNNPSLLIYRWRQGQSVPRKNFCVPIAQALGIEVEYVMACMEVARRRAQNLAFWRKQASREFHAAAIDAVNALLEKAAEDHEREGRQYLLLARKIRTRAHSI